MCDSLQFMTILGVKITLHDLWSIEGMTVPSTLSSRSDQTNLGIVFTMRSRFRQTQAN